MKLLVITEKEMTEGRECKDYSYPFPRLRLVDLSSPCPPTACCVVVAHYCIVSLAYSLAIQGPSPSTLGLRHRTGPCALLLIVRRWRRLSSLLIAGRWLYWLANLWDIVMRFLLWIGSSCCGASHL